MSLEDLPSSAHAHTCAALAYRVIHFVVVDVNVGVDAPANLRHLLVGGLVRPDARLARVHHAVSYARQSGPVQQSRGYG